MSTNSPAPDGSTPRDNRPRSGAKGDLERFSAEVADLDAPGIVPWAGSTFGGEIAFGSSLGAEDQVVTHMIATLAPDIGVFTLDTGRMFGESYELMARTEEALDISIAAYSPQTAAVQEMVRRHGINLFYGSVEHRKLCCHVRKVEPLRRALAGRRAWITGLRRSQSVTRASLAPVEWDEPNGLFKINPLVEWSEDEVWEYVREHRIPYNPLHDRGFPSIGCAPCTRAVEPGQDPRSGRWWWERPEHRECGLHVGAPPAAAEAPAITERVSRE